MEYVHQQLVDDPQPFNEVDTEGGKTQAEELGGGRNALFKLGICFILFLGSFGGLFEIGHRQIKHWWGLSHRVGVN